VASLQELLKYLEQFMNGNLSQHAQPHLPSGAPGVAGGAPSMPHVAMPSGGMPPGAMPPGAMPGGLSGAAPPGAPTPGMAGLPPELANASPQELQQAMQQFSQLHPELAPYLSTGDATDLQSVLGQLQAIPPQALESFAAGPGAAAEPGGFDLGAPLSAEFGDVPAFGATDPTDLSSFADGIGAPTAFSDLPSVLLDPTAGEFGPLPTTVGGGVDDDYNALASALTGDSGTDYTDLLQNLPTNVEPEPVQTFADTFDPVSEPFETLPNTFEEPLSSYDANSPLDEPMHGDVASALSDYQDQ
jgi:hypothetical protein